MSLGRYLRIPSPSRFLAIFDLQTGVELIMVLEILNKASGIYGLLAIFTGAHVSGFQLSMYIYSILFCILLLTLFPSIRRGSSALASLSFAYLYFLDGFLNALYTLAFAASWFLAVSSSSANGPGGKTMTDIGGFASPEHNVTSVDIPLPPGDTVVPVAQGDGPGGNVGQQGVASALFLQPESVTSLSIILILWVVRFYFSLVAFAAARKQVAGMVYPGQKPFQGRNEGEGWKGMLGRLMTAWPKSYWEGASEWAGGVGGKFRRSSEPEERRRLRSLP